MKESFSQDRKIDELKPKMATLESLDHLDVTPNETVVTAKLDGEFTLLAYDRNGESYTLNKWGHHRSDYPALNQIVEKMKQTQFNHVEFLCEICAMDNKPLKLPQFISLIKGEHQDLTKIHIAIWDLLSIDDKPITQPFGWKMQEVETWIKGCTHVAVVPYLLPRTLQDVKDFWNEYVLGKGYEGLVIRNRDHTYKLKPTLEVDAVVIGLNKKTSYGKALDLFQRGQITSIKLALMRPDGTFLELSDCASGITADLRTVLWKLMEFKVSEDDETVYIKPVAVCTVQYSDTFPKRREILKFDGEYRFRGYTQFISLREPRLIRFRPDKEANSQDVGVSQIPKNKLPKEEKSQPDISKTDTLMVREATPMSQVEVPRIVRPAIILTANDSFEQVLQRLYAEKWGVNSNLQADTLEEAVELQAKTFPCIEFQPIQFLSGKWVSFHRTTIKEWQESQEQKPQTIPLEDHKPKESTRVIRVKGEGADAYWQRNNTCVDYLTKLILTKMSEEQIKKITHSCGGDNAIEGINQQLQDDCWSKLEHPEWFGKYGSPYYIKPYLVLCLKLGLGAEAYQFLNEGTAFPRMPPEEQEEAEESVIGDCDICQQTRHIEQLEQCETCALIICDTCRPNHKHEIRQPNAEEEKEENIEDSGNEEEQPDAIPIQVSFRKMYSKEPIPQHQIGDTIETDRGTQGKIIEIKEGKDHNLDGKIYIIQEETGETLWIHESAIKGKPQPKQQSLSGFFGNSQNL